MSDDFDEKRYARLSDTAHRVKAFVSFSVVGDNDRHSLFETTQKMLQSLTTSQYFWIESIDIGNEASRVRCCVEFKACIGKGGYRLDKIGPFSSIDSMIDQLVEKAESLLPDNARDVEVTADCQKVSDSNYDPMMLM